MGNRQELFDRFISSGFGDINAHEDTAAHMTSLYEWNYAAHIPRDENASFLEVGCGMGQCLSWLKGKGYSNIFGVDVSAEMIEYTSKHVTGKVKRIDSIPAFLLEAHAAYDCIIMNDVIEHLEKSSIIDTLRVLYASLNSGGVLIIKTNNVSAITGARMRYEDFTHEVSFTEYSLRQVLRVAGIKDSSIHDFQFPRTSIARRVRAFAQWVVNQLWRGVYFLQYTTVPRHVHEFIFAVCVKK